MTPEELAAIHAETMEVPAPWSAETFAGFLAFPGCILAAEPGGFALGRVMADEAELLTLAVAGDRRRRGIGARCLAAFCDHAAENGARTAFLEVAETNLAARALYRAGGWAETGRRRGYYRTAAGGTLDAILMSRNLGHA